MQNCGKLYCVPIEVFLGVLWDCVAVTYSRQSTFICRPGYSLSVPVTAPAARGHEDQLLPSKAIASLVLLDWWGSQWSVL